jgi:hypothetical protein
VIVSFDMQTKAQNLLREKVKALPLERLEASSKDCLDFEQLGDLIGWLARNEN